MNRYLAMLHQADKKIETHQTDTLQNLQNPDDGSFVGFEGMPSSEYENFKTLQDVATIQTEHYEKIVVTEICPKLDAPIHHTKSAVENLSLTQSEETYPPTVDGKHSPTVEITLLNFMERYSHLITCQQCEHLTATGYCRVKPQYKPMPEAMRDCASFEALQGERVAIENAPYSTTELNDLLSRYEKKLFHHLVDCVACSFMDSRYCVDAFAIGSSYDAILLVFDDAASKREALLNTVIRARISGRKVFVSIDHDNLPTPQQEPVKPLVYGIGDSERLFVNHLMACTRCKPAAVLIVPMVCS